MCLATLRHITLHQNVTDIKKVKLLNICSCMNTKNFKNISLYFRSYYQNYFVYIVFQCAGVFNRSKPHKKYTRKAILCSFLGQIGLPHIVLGFCKERNVLYTSQLPLNFRDRIECYTTNKQATLKGKRHE
ncbi:hypothetical protein VNO80_03863 [Phaseolus coccineus]|uniref:Uncharacterized protein n=1 Tax=Phaseolus coccineus TaxID=3886 RepID=A0AAN9RNY7_PHACN